MFRVHGYVTDMRFDPGHPWLRSVAFLLLASHCAFGGGSPLETLVVVNDDEPRSQEIGKFYAELQDIPQRNILHVGITTNPTISASVYSNDLENPVHEYIAAAGLSNQIRTVVLANDFPYRLSVSPGVTNSVVGALHYGIQDVTAIPCVNPSSAFSPYYRSERAFDSLTITGLPFMVFQLAAFTLEQARDLVARSRNLTGIAPTGTYYYVHTEDEFRSVRWKQFGGSSLALKQIAPLMDVRTVETNWLVGPVNVAGYMTGIQYVSYINTVQFLPGGLGDHLTSFAGCLLDSSACGQMSLLNWIRYGASATYGTVFEPCAYTNKFPDAMLYPWYARGFSAGEVYHMSVQSPYQGVFVGDPLARPYAVTSLIDVAGLSPGQVVTGSVPLTITASSPDSNTIGLVEIFLDGAFHSTVTNLPPVDGNVVTALVNGMSRSYTVTPGDDLFDVAAGLADAINAGPDLGVTATAYSDRIELMQDALGISATGLSCVVATGSGTGAVRRLHARVSGTNFMETFVPAREGLSLSGNAKVGDQVILVITNLNGLATSNEYTVGTNGESYLSIFTNLAAAVNGDTNLQTAAGAEMKYILAGTTSAEAWLIARTNTWEGNGLHVSYTVNKKPMSTLTGPDFTDSFNDNADELRARTTIFLASGSTQAVANTSIDTSTLADGPHQLDIVTRSGDAVATVTRKTIEFSVDNHDTTCSILAPLNHVFIEPSHTVTTRVEAIAGAGSITQVSLYVEGKLLAVTSSPPYHFTWSASDIGAGRTELQARADDSTGKAAVSDVLSAYIVTDEDADLLPDQWEYARFGSITNWDGNDDPDGDLFSNIEEFLAGTQPTNALSRFEVVPADAGITNGSVPIRFVSSTERYYRVQLNPAMITNSASWSLAATSPIPGEAGSTLWPASATNLTPTFFRVEGLIAVP